MYNAQMHSKLVEHEAKHTRDTALRAKHLIRSQFLREHLAEKYNQRVDHFMLTMVSDPILVKQHMGPLPVAGRITHPEKYKGAASMILKGFSAEVRKERESLPKRNVKVQCPHPIETEPETKTVTFAKNLTTSHPLLPNLPPHLSRLSSAINERIHHQREPSSESPKQNQQRLTAAIMIDLDRKTHFKGVMSKISGPWGNSLKTPMLLPKKDKQHRTRTAEIITKNGKVLKANLLGFEETQKIARDVLQTCQVIPKTDSSCFLRVGEGKLISNPFEHTRDLYSRLYQGHSVSFTL